MRKYKNQGYHIVNTNPRNSKVIIVLKTKNGEKFEVDKKTIKEWIRAYLKDEKHKEEFMNDMKKMQITGDALVECSKIWDMVVT